MDLVHHQHFTSPFVEFVGEGEDPALGEIEIVEVDVEAVARIAELFLDEVEQEGGLAYSAEALDADDTGAPIYFMMKFPYDSYIVGID